MGRWKEDVIRNDFSWTKLKQSLTFSFSMVIGKKNLSGIQVVMEDTLSRVLIEKSEGPSYRQECVSLPGGYAMESFLQLPNKFPIEIVESETNNGVDWLESATNFIDKEQFDHLIMNAWALWNVMNKEMYGSKKQTVGNLVNSIKSYWNEVNSYKSALQLASTVQKWKPPPPDLVIVNFDGSFNAKVKVGGGGIVIRECDGFVLSCAAVKLGAVTDPESAETLTTTKALEFALQTVSKQDIEGFGWREMLCRLSTN
ncbi:hypothetical protein Golob_021310 [Gossypium lobatum]|uniref:RNase H type-1 domain-containing protein n=1 Tax=Gossypium lobatum TaxID=34289 RepID=A0A7J8LD38_9ROSI|nr:hypothetical protein [Gossypium lobatum]